MDRKLGGMRGLSSGDTAAVIACQRKLSAMSRLLTYDHQSALLDLDDLQPAAIEIVRDYADMLGEILEASQHNPNNG